MKLIKNNTIIYAIAIMFLLLGFTSSIVFAQPNESLTKADNIGMVNFILKDKSLAILHKENLMKLLLR